MNRRTAKRYLALFLFSCVFAGVYELFSHHVYSPWMICLPLYPLVLGVLPFLALKNRIRDGWGRQLWHCGVATCMVGSCLTGIFEIAGTHMPYTVWFMTAGGALLLLAVLLFGRCFRASFALLAAFLSLAVCSKSSFLYPLNDWVDVNCFFTVGRGILRGLMPYRDLYDQKGPLVYLAYALAAAVSESSFLGVFLLEVCCFAAFLALSGRLAEDLSGIRGAYWPAAALLAVLIPVTPAFSHGGSAEELFLPVLVLGLGVTLRAARARRPMTNGEAFTLGACAAAALWTKYTFCGLFAGLAAAILFRYAFSGMARRLPSFLGFALLGAAAVTAPVLGWFAARGALPDLWQAYFVSNLTAYSRNIRGGVYDPPLLNLLNNLTWSVPAALGLIWLTSGGRERGWEAASAWLGVVCLFAFTYASGRRYPYYALVLSAFAPLGLAAVCAWAGKALRGKTSRRGTRRRAATALTVCLTAAILPAAYAMSGNTYLMRIPREDTPQYRFASVIRQAEDQTLLNYGFLDGGFYFASGVTPSDRWFCTLNIDLPEMEESMRSSLRAGEPAFVVTRRQELDGSLPYHLADSCTMPFEGRYWTYFLYERN